MLSHWPIIEWPWALQLALVLCCAAMNAVLYVRGRVRNQESWSDLAFNMIGSNLFCAYILHRIHVQLGDYRQHPADFTVLSWLNWLLVMLTFLLFMGAYLLRTAPIQRASRPREVLMPLLCGTLPALVPESFSLGATTWVRSNELLAALFKPLAGALPGYWSVVSLTLMLAGHLISLWAMLHLRRSFSILTEVRGLVTSGPYRYVRHPLYVGESLAALGICYLLPSYFNIAVTVLFVLSQRLRAHWEEQKFLAVTPDYAAFRHETGAFWPRFRARG